MKVNYYNQKLNKSTKELKVEGVKSKEVNQELLAQYVRVHFGNKRQANANVKTRAQVRGGGKKPWRQKGTGRARVGSIRSPLWVGGGVIHGPKNSNFSLKIGKKAKKTLFKQVLQHKLQTNTFAIVNFDSIKQPKTKEVLNIITTITGSADTKTLIITSKQPLLVKSVSNLKHASTTDVTELNSVDLLKYNYILVSEKSLATLEGMLK